MSEAIQEENTQEAYDNEYEKAFFNGEETTEETPVEEAPVEETPVEEVEEAPLEESEGIEENPDEPLEDEEAATEEVIEPTDEEKRTLKWNGEDIEVTMEELIALGQKGFDYTSKMQTVSKYRKDLESAGISDEIVDIIKQVNQGDKSALAKLAKLNNIDPMDLIDIEFDEIDTNTPLKPSNEIVVSKEVAPLMEQVMSNPDLQAKMSRAEGLLPHAVIKRMAQDADLMYNAVSEIDSGSFDQVMPRVNMRLATLSDLDREYALNSPEVFGNLYLEEKSRLGEAPMSEQEAPQVREPQQARQKPNMAEVGVRKSSNNVRKSDVIKDAFTDDGEYQRILDKVRNSR